MMEGGAPSTIDDRATGPISESVNGGRSEAKLVRPAGLRHPAAGAHAQPRVLAVFRRGVRAHRGPVGQGGARAPRPISAPDDTVNGYGTGLEPGSPFPETDYTDSLPLRPSRHFDDYYVCKESAPYISS